MAEITCSLLADGSSDVVLIPILRWLMREHVGQASVRVEWADLSRHPRKPVTLTERIGVAIDLYPCRVLFVHRDAEAQPPELRYDEITNAVAANVAGMRRISHVCVVPVRMQEAWLLLDETAIRKAAGNPNGRTPIALPATGRVEAMPDPKQYLYDQIGRASELHGRRLKKLRPHLLARRVSDHMSDFSCLRALAAFQRLERDVQRIATVLRQPA